MSWLSGHLNGVILQTFTKLLVERSSKIKVTGPYFRIRHLRPMTSKYESGSCGCQDTYSCKISSSWVQRFMSYLAYREKKTLDENNTVRRYRADSKNRRTTVPGGLRKNQTCHRCPDVGHVEWAWRENTADQWSFGAMHVTLTSEWRRQCRGDWQVGQLTCSAAESWLTPASAARRSAGLSVQFQSSSVIIHTLRPTTMNVFHEIIINKKALVTCYKIAM